MSARDVPALLFCVWGHCISPMHEVSTTPFGCDICNRLAVMPDGQVSLCGVGISAPEMIMGNIAVSSLEDVWNNSTVMKLLTALLATLLVTAVPIGGGTISEMLIITMLGFPVAALPILTIIATIIDPPATMLNVVGDSASSMLVARIADGKNWLKEKVTKKKK